MNEVEEFLKENQENNLNNFLDRLNQKLKNLEFDKQRREFIQTLIKELKQRNKTENLNKIEIQNNKRQLNEENNRREQEIREQKENKNEPEYYAQILQQIKELKKAKEESIHQKSLLNEQQKMINIIINLNKQYIKAIEIKYKALLRTRKTTQTLNIQREVKELKPEKYNINQIQCVSSECISLKSILSELDHDGDVKKILKNVLDYFYKNNLILKEDIILLLNQLYYKLYEYLYNDNYYITEVEKLLLCLKSVDFETEQNEEMLKKYKEIILNFSFLCKIYKHADTANKNRKLGYFEIINHCLNDEVNYPYLKEILKKIPDITNTKFSEKYIDRKTESAKEKHIIIYLVDIYIKNFKKMVNKEVHINLHYLREIYFLFTRNSNFRIPKEDYNEIIEKLSNLSTFVETTLIKRNRKKAALEEIKQMKNSFNYHSKLEYTDEYEDDFFTYHKHCISTYLDAIIRREKRDNKEINNAFLISDNAYSIKQDKDNTYLSIHSIRTNIMSDIEKHDLLQEYLYHHQIINKPISPFLAENVKYKVDSYYPTITYTLKFDVAGNVVAFYVDEQIIYIEKRIYPNDIKTETSELYKLYQKSLQIHKIVEPQYDLYFMNKHFNELLNKEYIDFVQNEELPFIYYGYSIPTDEFIEKSLYQLSSSLHKIDKEDSTKIIEIFSNVIDKQHYSLIPIKNGVYKFNLLEPFNLVAALNQSVLKNLYFNERLLNEERLKSLKKVFQYEFEKLLRKLNENQKIIFDRDYPTNYYSTRDYSDKYTDTESLKGSYNRIKRKI